MPRTGDFLIRRPDSQMWQLQLIIPPDFHAAMQAESPGERLPKKIVKSMQTTDRVVARRRSLDIVEEFKASLSVFRALREPSTIKGRPEFITYKVPPGRHEKDDGTVTLATERTIMHLDRDGLPISDEPNVPNGWKQHVVYPDTFGGHPFRFTRERPLLGKYDLTQTNYERIKSGEPRRDIDMEIIDNWADANKKKPVNPRFVKDAKDCLALWRKHCPGKTFSNADWDDGRELADLLASELNNKSATVRKKIAFLRRAFVLAKRSSKKFPSLIGRENPFSSVVENHDDALDKVMFDDADTELIKSRIDELGRNERTLLIWCLATGCRRSEPFCIAGEKKIDGFRTIRFEEEVKNPPSDRTIPLPPRLLELHPDPITGPLFTDTEKNIGRNINRWLRRIGITDPSKTLHSTRHRAAYRLRGVVEKDSVRHECLGHEDRAQPSEMYGAYPQKPLWDALQHVW